MPNQQSFRWAALTAIVAGVLTLSTASVFAQSSAQKSITAEHAPLAEVPTKAVPLNPEKTIFIDKPGNKLLLKTKVCLREGVLEMFICPKQTKEHESVLSWAGKAQIAHAGLLALGAKAGQPARFLPTFSPPEGDIIEVYVNWKEAEGKPQRVPARQWIRHATSRYFEAPLEKLPAGVKGGEGDAALRYDDIGRTLLFFGTMTAQQKARFLAMSPEPTFQKAVESLFQQGQYQELEAEFVFSGSQFHRRDDGTEVYLAEAGSFLCVANFSDAMIDVNVQSTASNDSGLLFEPWTERLPPLGTDVIVELIPTPGKRGTTEKTESK